MSDARKKKVGSGESKALPSAKELGIAMPKTVLIACGNIYGLDETDKKPDKP